jgi:hypothetical protein
MDQLSLLHGYGMTWQWFVEGSMPTTVVSVGVVAPATARLTRGGLGRTTAASR